MLKRLKFSEVRQMFFQEHPQFKSEYKKTKKHNNYSTDVRVSFSDYVDYLYTEGLITEHQVNNITLG